MHRLVACRCHEDAAGSGHLADNLVEEVHVVAEAVGRAFAEGNHAGLAHAGGIVEDVFVAKGIGGGGV